MAEYIERDAAVSYAQQAYNEWNLAMAAADGKREINLVYKRQELCKAVKFVFSGMPSADVAPVVHGHWVNVGPYTTLNGEYKKMQECSVCRAAYVSDGNTPWINHKYCPNCGAKMDGEQHETD